jgi:hypothetical protein
MGTKSALTTTASVYRQRTGVRDQRSEIRDQGSEIRGQGTEIRDRMSEGTNDSSVFLIRAAETLCTQPAAELGSDP